MTTTYQEKKKKARFKLGKFFETANTRIVFSKGGTTT